MSVRDQPGYALLTTPTGQRYEDDIDLLRYGRFLASHWFLLATGAVAGALAGLVIASRAPVLYQATATMTVTQPLGTTALALSPATSRALLANMTLVSETLNELQLNRGGLTPQAFVEDHLEIQPVPTTTLLRVNVSLPDPEKARLAAKLLAEKAVALSRRVDQDGAVAVRDALKIQVDESAQRFDQAQDRLLKFKSSAQVDMLQAQTDSKLERRFQMSRLAIELESEKARLASMGRAVSIDLPRRDTQRAGREASELPSVDGNPSPSPVSGMLQYEMAASRARVASLEKEYKETVGATGGAGAVKELSELYRRKMELSRLEADYDVSKRVYSDLGTKYEEARGRVAGNSAQLRILDAPVLPDRPLPRRRPQFAILGGLVGMMFGAAAALVINRRRALQSLS
jgi:uncharacterized protein involved in exopolysaccharide biosynthesis